MATERLYKTCISRYDNCAPYTRIQSLDAVSAHSNALCEADNRSESDDEIDGDAAAAEPREENTQPPATQSDDHAELCEVCLIQPRESRLALVP